MYYQGFIKKIYTYKTITCRTIVLDSSEHIGSYFSTFNIGDVISWILRQDWGYRAKPIHKIAKEKQPFWVDNQIPVTLLAEQAPMKIRHVIFYTHFYAKLQDVIQSAFQG